MNAALAFLIQVIHSDSTQLSIGLHLALTLLRVHTIYPMIATLIAQGGITVAHAEIVTSTTRRRRTRMARGTW